MLLSLICTRGLCLSTKNISKSLLFGVWQPCCTFRLMFKPNWFNCFLCRIWASRQRLQVPFKLIKSLHHRAEFDVLYLWSRSDRQNACEDFGPQSSAISEAAFFNGDGEFTSPKSKFWKMLGAPCIVIWTTLKYVLSVFWQTKIWKETQPQRKAVHVWHRHVLLLQTQAKLVQILSSLTHPELWSHFHYYSIPFFFTTIFFNGTEGLVCFADKRSQSGSLGCQSPPAPLKLFLKSWSWELQRGSWQLNSPRRCVIGTRTQ